MWKQEKWMVRFTEIIWLYHWAPHSNFKTFRPSTVGVHVNFKTFSHFPRFKGKQYIWHVRTFRKSSVGIQRSPPLPVLCSWIRSCFEHHTFILLHSTKAKSNLPFIFLLANFYKCCNTYNTCVNMFPFLLHAWRNFSCFLSCKYDGGHWKVIAPSLILL